MTAQYLDSEPFGTLLGYGPGGVAIYSSDYNKIDSKDEDSRNFRHYVNDEYMGYKWQCVEFARRYLYLNHGLVFTDVSMAYEIFSLRFLRQVVNDAILPLQAFKNGGKQPPKVGSLLIWREGGEFHRTGHVAIITEVLENKVRIVEQNVIHYKLPLGQQWTRELPLVISNDTYYIQDTFDDTEILGWMIQMEPNEHSLPIPQVSSKQLNLNVNYLDKTQNFSNKWLNVNDVIENAYVNAMQGHKIHNGDHHRFFSMTQHAENELIRATNELHLMYLHATDYVLRNDQLLEKFNIPSILWPRLRFSWANRRYNTITGRLDFCMDERGLKVYEYNADSASCHTETSVILARWAESGKLDKGTDPGEELFDSLINSWKHSDADPFVHIMLDNDKEEHYHALFMQKALTQAGFQTKMVCGLNELHWDERGCLVDNDNRQIRSVWKTWAWETVLEQLRQESEVEVLPINTGNEQRKVRLMDVLLRPEIKVFEPLWTVVTSNKAILPILWELFPDHRYLLEASYELTDTLITQGYAKKPIAGRGGHNIELIGNEQVLDKTQGRFAEQENIYQRLWCLPKVDDQYIQVCTFLAGGHYAGTCLRSDSTLVITGESDIQPLRVI